MFGTDIRKLKYKRQTILDNSGEDYFEIKISIPVDKNKLYTKYSGQKIDVDENGIDALMSIYSFAFEISAECLEGLGENVASNFLRGVLKKMIPIIGEYKKEGN